MRTFASKLKAPQQAAPAKATIPWPSLQASSILQLQRTIGNRAVQAKLAINEPGDVYEQEADRVTEQVMQIPDAQLQPSVQTKPVQAGGTGKIAAPPTVNETLRSPGQPLDPATRAFMEPRFDHDFSQVRVHSGEAAEQSARDVNAHAYTVGHDIVFGAGGFAPGTHEGRRLIAHELTHVVQQSGASGRIARKTLTDLPATTRKILKISRAEPERSALDQWIENYLDPQSGLGGSAGITTEFGTEITDPDQQSGLSNIAENLERGPTDPEELPLPPNSILDLALDLRPYGGEHAVFRFTRYGASSADKVLIEKTHVLATATPAGAAAISAPAGQPAAGAAASFTGPVLVGNVTVMIDSSFSNDEGKAIADAVQLLPDPIRARIDGVKILSAGSGKGPRGQNGEYNEAEDKVRLWDAVFDDSPRRAGAVTSTAYQIVHELGHVVDLRPLFKAQLARDRAIAARSLLERDLKSSPIKTPDAPIPDPGAGEAEKTRLRSEIARMDKEIEALGKASASAKSIAGFELGADTERLLTAFGKALAADGVKTVKNAKKHNRAIRAANERALSENAEAPVQPEKKTLSTGMSYYAAGNLMEAFAENFAAYVLDEALLRAIRPKTHAYFAKTFPKTAGAKP
ncbi:MAG: hypothetical protein QOH06_6180 [Acidobacteriota bacterium]|jgi:hypothetical protein|nr:hypothetical protein [Acidobacteriota bacterium]